MVRRIAIAAGVGVFALSGVAWAAQAGTYRGKTSQRHGTINLKVSADKVVKVTFADGTGVGSGCSQFGAVTPQFPVSLSSHAAIGRHGNFSITGSPRSGEVFKITAVFSANRVTGSFTDSIPIGQETGHGFTCSSGRVTFTATR